MKGDRPRITLLGSNSGKNLGDAAIMSAILDVLTKEIPGSEFYVPTTNPPFVDKNYSGKYAVKGVDIMPWTLSLRFLGVPTFLCLKKSDIALICDGIIFGKKLFNPAFNFLITLVIMVPLAKLVGCKVVCYSTGIGPFRNWLSRIFAKWTINTCDLVIMRENDSKKLAEEIGVTKPIHVTGDAAFLNPVSSEARSLEILKNEGIDPSVPILGVNVTSYFDSWLAKGEQLQDKDSFIKMLAEGISLAQQKHNHSFQVVVFSTHPMDEAPVFELARMLGGRVIHNSRYLSHDIMSVMRRCELFVGMRFHSVVLASAVESPIVGLIYAPKVRGFLRQLGCEEYALELAQLSAETLRDSLAKAWTERKTIQSKQKAVIDGLKAGARQAARTVRERYFPAISPAEEPAEVRLASGA